MHSKYALDHKVVIFLQRHFVRLAESHRELFRLVGLCVLQCFAGEGKTAQQPHQALSSGALLFPLLVLYELLKRGRQRRVCIVAGANFL